MHVQKLGLTRSKFVPGVLHDVKATEKSIAAGGRDSIKDEETGISDPYAIKKAISSSELKAKVDQLQKLVLRTQLPGETHPYLERSVFRQMILASTPHLL